MANVTVMGANNQTVGLCFDTEETTRLARLLAGAITSGVQSGSIVAATDKFGGPPPVPPGKTGEFVQTKSGTVILPNGYTALVETASNALVFGNTMLNQMILSGTASNLTFVSAGGSGTVVAAGDHNRISLSPGGKGSWDITTGNGNDIINALGSGQHTISAGGGDNAILLGTGNTLIESRGDDTVSMGGASATIDATSGGSTLVFGGSGDLFFVAARVAQRSMAGPAARPITGACTSRAVMTDIMAMAGITVATMTTITAGMGVMMMTTTGMTMAGMTATGTITVTTAMTGMTIALGIVATMMTTAAAGAARWSRSSMAVAEATTICSPDRVPRPCSAAAMVTSCMPMVRSGRCWSAAPATRRCPPASTGATTRSRAAPATRR